MSIASEVKSQPVNFTHGGANSTEILAPVAGRRLAVLGLALSASGAASLSLTDTDGVAITGLMSVAANGNLTWPVGSAQWCRTGVAKGIKIVTSAAASVGGVIIYEERL